MPVCDRTSEVLAELRDFKTCDPFEDSRSASPIDRLFGPFALVFSLRPQKTWKATSVSEAVVDFAF